MRTLPSACWWFSRSATSHRVLAAVPLRVATGRVPDSVRSRTFMRRAWKVVQFEVDVSSRYVPWVGIHASVSYLRAAESPRSPAAMSRIRYDSSHFASISSSTASMRACSASASSTRT